MEREESDRSSDRSYEYSESYYGLKTANDAKDVRGWFGARCELDPSARYPMEEFYRAYCLDAERPQWPLQGAISVNLFSRALLKASRKIERRRINGKAYVVGARPKSLISV